MRGTLTSSDPAGAVLDGKRRPGMAEVCLVAGLPGSADRDCCNQRAPDVPALRDSLANQHCRRSRLNSDLGDYGFLAASARQP